MKKFAKALTAAAALGLVSMPMMAQAADVRPGDARVQVSSVAVPSAVRASNAANGQTSELGGAPAWLLALLAGLIAAGGIIAATDGNSTSP